MQHDQRPLKAHLAPLARRGDKDALAMLRAPDFPPVFGYLFDWYAEFLTWHDGQRSPTWADWQAWATLMSRAVTPFDLRMLARIHNAFAQMQQRSAENRAHG